MAKQNLTSVYINGAKVFALVSQDHVTGLKRFEDAIFAFYFLKPTGFEVLDIKDTIRGTATIDGKEYTYWFTHYVDHKSFGTLVFKMSTARAFGGVQGIINHLMATYRPFSIVNLNALNGGNSL